MFPVIFICGNLLLRIAKKIAKKLEPAKIRAINWHKVRAILNQTYKGKMDLK